MQDEIYAKHIAPITDAGADFHKIAELFEPSAEPMTILDCGCSNGTVTGSIVADHFVVGLDLLESVLVEASARGLAPVCSDASSRLPFKDESFDLVILGDILEHLVDPEHLVKETARVLKRGAKVIASVPNYYSIVRRYRFLRGRSLVINSHEPYRSYNYFHLRFFTLDDFNELFERLGFRILRHSYKWAGGCGYEDKPMKRFWKRFNKLPERLKTWLTNRRPTLFSHEFALLAMRPDTQETPDG